MTFQDILALAAFALVTSVTPGPNNMMLLASGAHFGLRRTLPHLLGVAAGFVFMLLLVGTCLARVLEASPLLGELLRWVCVLVLLRLAFGLVRSGGPAEAGVRRAPLSFLQAAGFQWLNPKSWAMALTAVGAYAPSADPLALGMAALVFGSVNLPSTGLWAVLGVQVRGALAEPARLRAFNVVMAALLLLSSLPVVLI